MSDLLPASPGGWLLGRIWRPELGGPSVVTVREGEVFDITCRQAPLVRDICEMEDPVAWLRDVAGKAVGSVDAIATNVSGDPSTPHFLAPCDLQAIKACGVTFARSMVERVIEEQAAGDPQRAAAIRDRVSAVIGDDLRHVRPGSAQAAQLKAALIELGVWSQYLEVGIGPDAEVFTKSQVLSAVGPGAPVGLHPASKWNNPEPEVVLAVSSAGRVVGAALGNDVNLRDVEGRSALLLGKAKDNNASCAIGPFIRLFERGFGLDDLRRTELTLRIEGQDGYLLTGRSAMSEISRDPVDLVAQTLGRHHQYPDGLMLFLGTLFAPTEDRETPGEGFTHKRGDRVTISAPELGTLTNSVRLCTDCPPWTFGARALMANLAQRRLL